jgi:hypothetical protein
MNKKNRTANIAFVKARQTELGCAKIYNLAVVQVMG